MVGRRRGSMPRWCVCVGRSKRRETDTYLSIYMGGRNTILFLRVSAGSVCVGCLINMINNQRILFPRKKTTSKQAELEPQNTTAHPPCFFFDFLFFVFI